MNKELTKQSIVTQITFKKQSAKPPKIMSNLNQNRHAQDLISKRFGYRLVLFRLRAINITKYIVKFFV